MAFEKLARAIVDVNRLDSGIAFNKTLVFLKLFVVVVCAHSHDY